MEVKQYTARESCINEIVQKTITNCYYEKRTGTPKYRGWNIIMTDNFYKNADMFPNPEHTPSYGFVRHEVGRGCAVFKGVQDK
jgi:hypothetical protein